MTKKNPISRSGFCERPKMARSRLQRRPKKVSYGFQRK
jgi:hypothetical protein